MLRYPEAESSKDTKNESSVVARVTESHGQASDMEIKETIPKAWNHGVLEKWE
jgi:hypothetical protein